MYPISDVDDRVTLYLAIESLSLTSSALTGRLGVHPDREWAVGEPRGKTGKLWECHGWIIEETVTSAENSSITASLLIPIAIQKFEERVQSLAEPISHLCNSANVYVVLSVIAQDTPGMEFRHSFLNLLSSLGGTFQVDLIVNNSI